VDVVLAASDNGLWRSPNGGQSWGNVSLPSGYGLSWLVVADPNAPNNGSVMRATVARTGALFRLVLARVTGRLSARPMTAHVAGMSVWGRSPMAGANLRWNI
jgi:hypothetical protein